MRRWIPWGLVLLIMLAGCGRPAAAPRLPETRETLVLAWTPGTLSALPIAVALEKHWFRHAGFRLQNAAGGGAAEPPGRWPAIGFLTQRSDWVLAAPIAEPDFRWRDLRRLPLPTSGLTGASRQLVQAVLLAHGVQQPHWDDLSPHALTTLLRSGRVPWALLPLTTAARLTDPRLHIIAFVGAATGPLPVTVLTGTSIPPQALAVLNRALAFCSDRPPEAIARLVAPNYPGLSDAALTAVIADAQALSLFPSSTYLSQDTYTRGQRLLATVDVAWPDYASAVEPAAALRALTLWP